VVDTVLVARRFPNPVIDSGRRKTEAHFVQRLLKFSRNVVRTIFVTDDSNDCDFVVGQHALLGIDIIQKCVHALTKPFDDTGGWPTQMGVRGIMMSDSPIFQEPLASRLPGPSACFAPASMLNSVVGTISPLASSSLNAATISARSFWVEGCCGVFFNVQLTVRT